VAYPFVNSPTFAEFRYDLLARFSCQIVPLHNLDYSPHRMTCIERQVGASTRCWITDLPDIKRMAPDTIRFVCRRLDIDPNEFGLALS
jgi:hypothetical protein